MNQVPDHMTRSSKTGAEDVILMRLQSDRLNNHIPPHYHPPLDSKSRFQVAMVNQSCKHNSFDGHEIGHASEFHFWLRIKPFVPDNLPDEDSIKFPVQSWLSLVSASDNPVTREYLQSFGFKPLTLQKVEFQEKEGAVIFQDRCKISWTILGHGRGFKQVNVDHVLNTVSDRTDSAGHHISAFISDPIMDQPGRVYIQTDACEPFLHRGERFAVIVQRMSWLEATVLWKKKEKNY